MQIDAALLIRDVLVQANIYLMKSGTRLTL